MKNLSLRTKTLILLVMIVVLATVPLITYSIWTIQKNLSELGTDPVVENTLESALDRARDNPAALMQATDAIKRYRQIAGVTQIVVRDVLIKSIVYAVIVVLLALLAGYFFVLRITRPLMRLTEATAGLARGKYDLQIEAGAGGEIGVLVKSFNSMARELVTAREQQAIAQRRATWQQVARTIAHEIKNPLTPIKLSTERMYEKYLKGSPDFPEVIKSTSTIVLEEIDNLQKLVEVFHTYAKFPEPDLKPENLSAIIREVTQLYSVDSVQISIDAASVQQDIVAHIDKGQFREAIGNLIKNGIEAIGIAGRADGEGRISVLVKKMSNRAIILITDNGCGIAPENIDKLFVPYFTTKKHGSGIGLALTERIVSSHGGTISCASVPGKETSFTIAIPVA